MFVTQKSRLTPMRKPMLPLTLASLALASLTGCGSGSSSTDTPVVNTSNSVTKAIPAAGGTIALKPVNGTTYSLNFPQNAVAATTSVTITPIDSGSLTVPITRAFGGRSFTPNTNNTYLTAFKIDATPTVTKFNVPVTIGATGVTGYPAGTILNIAQLVGSQWNDVGTLSVDSTGNLTSQLASYTLPGVLAPGTYVIYKPGTAGTTLANFGVVLIADDNSSGKGLQVVNLYDTAGNILSTPSLKSLAFPNANDLDGQAMTPDGQYGILVDGGNTVRFFSNVNTGVPVASQQTLDISSYGGDGDAVAIMPKGDEAVVAGDTNQLLVVSGISAGAPATADVIAAPGNRDGVTISNDGKVLLARGRGGLTVYSIAAKTPAAGTLGGTSSYAYTQTTDIPAAGVSGLEDGRDGMAISPTDSSRAVIVGSGGNPTVELYTGLPLNPTRAVVPLHLPASSVTLHRSARVKSRRTRGVVTPTGISRVYSVSITPDGKNAIVGTDTGLVLLTGVDTGNLVQVGTPYAPSFTVSGTSYTLNTVHSLAITLDGKNVVACSSSPSSDLGTLLVIPFTSAGFGAIAGQLNGVSIPSNDQILVH